MAKVVLENIYKTFSKTASPQEPVAQEPESSNTAGSSLRGTSVLRRINLVVKDGEFLVLVGPSGCGKSTLLRLIAGLETLTAGNIWVGDRRVNDLPPKVRDIAMVFQSYALYPHLTVYDNLAFGLRRMGQRRGDPQSTIAREFLPPKPETRFPSWLDSLLVSATRRLPQTLRYLSPQERQIQDRVQEVAQMLQIDTLLNRLPRQLSGGQKQRVALGRAIARNPQVFLMDEPLSNLDAKLRAETRAQIVNLQQLLGTTTLYVTHDQIEAMTMGQRIAVMSEGQIQQVATPLELYNNPANRFVAGFIGSPPMNFIPVQIKASLTVVHEQFRFSLPEFWEPMLLSYADQTLWLGIRPEHLKLSSAAVKNLPGVVEQVEALGSDTYLTVRLLYTEHRLQVRIEPEQRVDRGETVHLSLKLEKLHLFEFHSGKSLRSQ